MKNGFITLSLTGYIALGCAAVVGLVSAYAYVQTKRLEACKAEFQVFKAEVERLGLEAKEKAKQVEAQDKFKKEKADEDLRKLRSLNDDLSKRVRDNAGSSFVPSTGSVTGIPETACFNTEALDGAIKRFAERVTGITEQGQSAITDLDNAKRWSQSP